MIEASTLSRPAEVAKVLEVSRQAVVMRLKACGYDYSALKRERSVIRAEALEVRNSWRQKQWLAPHGTKSAYVRHLRHGEKACVPCLDANAAEARVAQKRARDRDRPDRRRDSPETAARRSASLRRLYRGEGDAR
jgi:hypothetical protein